MEFNEQKYLIWSKFINESLNTNSLFSNRKETAVPLNTVFGFSSDPSSTLSKILSASLLKSGRSNRSFIDMPTHKLSSLVPFIQLYKVVGNAYQPFYFPRFHQDKEIETIMSEGGRLSGAGIKSFDVFFEGKDTFTSDKLLRCNLNFFIQDMKSFFTSPGGNFAPLAELITAREPNQFVIDTNSKVHAEQLNRPRSIEIKADLGWAVYPEMSKEFTQEEIEAVRNNTLSLRLTLVDHSINFSQEGVLTISAQYIGRLESMLDSKSSDILMSSEDLNMFGNLNKQIDSLKETYKSVDDAIDDQEKQVIEEESRTNLIQNFSTILDRMDPKDGSAFFTEEMTLAKEEEFFQSIQTSKQSNTEVDSGRKQALRKATSTPPLNKPKNKRSSKKKKLNLADRTIHYIYLADLLEQVMLILKENYMLIKDSKVKKQLETFRIILGDFRLSIVEKKGGTSSATRSYSLGEFPVSTRAFSEWFRDNIIKPAKVKFGFLTFLETMIKDLVYGSLNNMNYRDAPIINDNVKFGMASLVSLSGHGNLKGKTSVKMDEIPSFSATMKTEQFDNDVDYMVFYSYVTSQPSQSNKSGDADKDEKDGVFHLYLGQDKGIIKTINFNKVDLKYRKEFLIANSYSLFDELRMPYNASISMFGNTLFRPGSQLFINPSSIGLGDPRNENSPAVRLGLGGYYTVTGITMELSENGFNTELQSVFTGWPEAKGVGGRMSQYIAQQVATDRDIDKSVGLGESPDTATATFVAPTQTMNPYSNTSPSSLVTAGQGKAEAQAAAMWVYAHPGQQHPDYLHQTQPGASHRGASATMVTVRKKRHLRHHNFLFDASGNIIPTSGWQQSP